jgi:hypothetical protein
VNDRWRGSLQHGIDNEVPTAALSSESRSERERSGHSVWEGSEGKWEGEG